MMQNSAHIMVVSVTDDAGFLDERVTASWNDFVNQRSRFAAQG
jgi:hypothetical protein